MARVLAYKRMEDYFPVSSSISSLPTDFPTSGRNGWPIFAKGGNARKKKKLADSNPAGGLTQTRDDAMQGRGDAWPRLHTSSCMDYI